MPESKEVTGRLPNHTLQEERLRRGWTQQELADQVGSTVVNVSRWERGATFPNPYFRQRLCEIFEKDANALGLLSVRQTPQRETEVTSEEISPEPSEEERIVIPRQSPSLPLQQRFWGRRRTVVTLVSSALAVLATGSGLLIVNMLHKQELVGSVIAKDTFQRPNQMHWGTTSDGHKWMEDANALPNFSISNHTAQLTPRTGHTFFNAILEAKANNAEVLFSGSMSGFQDSNLGAVLRWTDTNNLYKAFIDGTQLTIEKRVDGNKTALKTKPFPASTGTLYTIRFRAVGTSLMMKVWPTASGEPSDWMATISDDTFSSGLCGLRIELLNDAIATITSFIVTGF